MKQLMQFLFHIFLRCHLLVCLLIISVVIMVLPVQIRDRSNFANTELYNDVIERWGGPIIQSTPSIRYMETGTVFTELKTMPFSSQTITINTLMNYRKRGLVYFSGFDFDFNGKFSIINTKNTNIDLVFVFPINLEKNKVLLSDLNFYVDNTLTPINLSETRDKLIWTGRLKKEQAITFLITYTGRGLNEFTYVLDPDLPVKDFHLTAHVKGGVNYDYPYGVIPATTIVDTDRKNISLSWDYSSLESGVPVGLILPSEESYDAIITLMTQRSWVPFILFFSGIIGLFLFYKKPLPFYTAYLFAASYSFFFVLLAYLAAYLQFYTALSIAFLIIAAMLFLYTFFTLSKKAAFITLGLFVIYQLIPSMAVVLRGHTGLIYTVEILIGLCMLMVLVSREKIQNIITGFQKSVVPGKESL